MLASTGIRYPGTFSPRRFSDVFLIAFSHLDRPDISDKCECHLNGRANHTLRVYLHLRAPRLGLITVTKEMMCLATLNNCSSSSAPRRAGNPCASLGGMARGGEPGLWPCSILSGVFVVIHVLTPATQKTHLRINTSATVVAVYNPACILQWAHGDVLDR